MRVVLDTNVIVAAFASRGLCSEVFEVCIAEYTIVTSEYILSEVKEKLIHKVHLTRSISLAVIDYLREITEIFKPEHVDTHICRDIDDVKIIGTAMSGKARFIITGDEDLLVLKKYGGLEIITPREFWSRLKGIKKSRLNFS
ncbi:MAG: putative toxin-antitoxin system toxin component, PIN family [Nitrospirota bacterium]